MGSILRIAGLGICLAAGTAGAQEGLITCLPDCGDAPAVHRSRHHPAKPAHVASGRQDAAAVPKGTDTAWPWEARDALAETGAAALLHKTATPDAGTPCRR